MSKLYLTYGTLLSPLGTGIDVHKTALNENRTGLTQQLKSGFSGENWYLGKMNLPESDRFNSLLEAALHDLLNTQRREGLSDARTLIIVSSTKANLQALPEDTFASIRTIVARLTQNPNAPLILSNACISGVLAINTAADYLRAGLYDCAVIIGIDALFDFVIYGFQSLFALSDAPCRPFDKERKGISLGEACGIVILSTERPATFAVEYLSGASSNDANHISGPSRTGEGLVRAVQWTLKRANITPDAIDFISAHGTGTLYNDEMESIAFERLGLSSVPVNSLKGYFGHTLGAAGIIEVIVCLMSIEEQRLYKSVGYSECGTSVTLNLLTENRKTAVTTVLKTASGFGGGNASLLLKRLP